MRVVRIILATALLGAMAACVRPAELRPVLADQSEAIRRLTESGRAAIAANRAMAEAALRSARVDLVRSIELSIGEAGYATTAGADLEKFRADLADASVTNAIVGEVRLGRMTAPRMEALLRDWATSWKLAEGRPVRDALIGRLAPVERFDADAALLLEAIDRAAAHQRTLAAEAAAANETLVQYAATPAPWEAAADAWQAPAMKMAGPPGSESAARAAKLWGRLFGPTAGGNP